MTRQTEGVGVLNPDQRLTRAEAIRFYTINNARLHYEEREKGSIEPGKLADLILVDRDPLTCPDDDLKATAGRLDDGRRQARLRIALKCPIPPGSARRIKSSRDSPHIASELRPMDGRMAGLAGGFAGGVIGLMGGAIGTYFSIKNTGGPRERAFMIRLSILGWIGITAFLAVLLVVPQPWKMVIWIIYVPALMWFIRWGNHRQAADPGRGASRGDRDGELN